jgi:diguanylate cyclase (GGDEF)-like protein
MREKLARIHTYLLRQNAAAVPFTALVMIGLLGWLDYASGFEISFSFFYLIPIALTTIYLNVEASIIVTAIAIIVWVLSNQLAGLAVSSNSILYWNALIRLVVFSLFAVLLNEFRNSVDHEQILARTDFLTGLINRREFYRVAELEILRAKRHTHPFAISYIDIDHFKEVNDNLGHAAGDKLLQDVARLLQKSLRKTDIIARMGGDEIAILLPETNRDGAEHAINKIRRILMEEIKLVGIPVAFSTGVAFFKDPPETVDDMLKIADGLMYQAKSEGKGGLYFAVVD